MVVLPSVKPAAGLESVSSSDVDVDVDALDSLELMIVLPSVKRPLQTISTSVELDCMLNRGFLVAVDDDALESSDSLRFSPCASELQKLECSMLSLSDILPIDHCKWCFC